METKRTHDSLYLNENYKKNPKEQYKFILDEICKDYEFSRQSEGGGWPTLIDIGCETGSFLYYVLRRYPEVKLTGMDVLPELLEHLNDGLKKGTISPILADITKKDSLPDKKFDIVTMAGVLSIFDDWQGALDNALDLLKGDVLYLYGIFNPKALDVNIKTKHPMGEAWESGWNYISQKSLELFCKERDLTCEFVQFHLNVDIEEQVSDPLRTWTIPMINGEKMIVNGIQLIHHFYLCKIKKRCI